jgi:hypothetical protein
MAAILTGDMGRHAEACGQRSSRLALCAAIGETIQKVQLESLIQADLLEDFVGEVTRWHLRRERDRFAGSWVAPDIMAALAVAQELKASFAQQSA